jgi:hypothetical protein
MYYDIDSDANVWQIIGHTKRVWIKKFRTVTEAMAFIDKQNNL